VIATLFLAAAAPAEEQVPPPEPDPVDSGLVEEVQVKLVLLDVLVLDRKDRTVASLGRDDFELTVDGRPVEIASVDVACPDGATPDVTAAREAADRPLPEASVPHRIVHAFDYDHMENVALTLEQAREAVRRHSRAGDEQMLIAIGPTLRLEQDFTSDPAALDRALERMHDDLGLYGAHLGRLTDRRFYQRLQSLLDLLDRIDGPKVVVLYSGPFPADGFNHDVEFRRISALSARARVALYPVDTGGLRTPQGFVYGDLGGPKELARLAVESGGRVTYHTNDLGLALARAQRDLGCRYTLGFYDASPIRDRARSVRVWLPRSSMRAIHSVAYVIRSDERLLADRLRTARMVPELFDSGGMQIEARALRALERRWEVEVSVALPEAARTGTADEPWTLEGTVRSASGAALAKFRRVLSAEGAAAGMVNDETITERLDVAPGTYRVGVVLVRDGLEEPLAAAVPLDLPPIPKEDLAQNEALDALP
jgi:VWFA-related protein